MARTRKKLETATEPTRYEFETFRTPSAHTLGNLEQKEPSSFNGFVQVTRYRVLVELIEEPPEVVFERIRKLWRECDNSHHYHPLQVAARKLGFELDSAELGKDRKRNNQ